MHELSVLLAFAAISQVLLRSAEATDRTVPDPYQTIQVAINAATAGSDRVVITQANTYAPFTLSKAVEVTRADNLSTADVIVNGSGTSFACSITSADASVTKLSLRGGSSGIVDLQAGMVSECAITDNGVSYSAGVVQLDAGASLVNSTLTLTSGTGRAVFIYGTDRDNITTVGGNAFNVVLSGSTYPEAVRVGYVSTDNYAYVCFVSA